MNAIEILTKVKTMLGMETEAKFTDAKLADGTLVSFDRMEVDGTVEAIAEDGTKTPLMAGTYELEDGTSFACDETGKITDVVAREMTPATAPQTPEVPEVEIEVEEPEDAAAVAPDRMAELENRISELEKLYESLISGLAEVKQSQENRVSELETKLAEVSSAPATTTVTLHSEEPVKLTKFDRMSAAIDEAKKQLGK